MDGGGLTLVGIDLLHEFQSTGGIFGGPCKDFCVAL
jgi:hypothetical protein